MAIYHMSAKIISRKSGRSATAAAAYRAAEQITDERTGEIHNFQRKRGVLHSEIVMPTGSDWEPSRSELWNTVEAKNKRADAQVAREFIFALPDELTESQRLELAHDFAREIVDKYQVAGDLALHAPSRAKGADERNHHAHFLTSTNRVNGRGFGNKVRELDLVAHNMGGKLGQKTEVEHLRERWATLTNAALDRAGHAARIDHRSFKNQGINREPSKHNGPQLTALLRRGGRSYIEERRASERLAIVRTGQLEYMAAQTERQIIVLETDLQLALAERLRMSKPTPPPRMSLDELRARSRASTQGKNFALHSNGDFTNFSNPQNGPAPK